MSKPILSVRNLHVKFTLRGRELLERAEVVIYDYLANPRLLRHAPKTAELIYVGKKGGGQFHFVIGREL